jgi:hypothetical protein
MDEDTFTDADLYSDAEEVDFQDAAPDDVGQGEVEEYDADTEFVEATEPERDYFDPSTVADKYVRTKVDGEDVEVPVAELVQGYQRQADYTRKTQSLAQEREEIAFWKQVDQAAKVNPKLTMEYLSERFGLSQAPEPEPEDDWGYEAENPYAKELKELREQVAPAIEYAQAQQAAALIDNVVKGLSQKYGEDFNAKEVIGAAYERGIYDPYAFEMVYKDVSFDRYRAAALASKEVAQKRNQTEGAKKAAARGQSTVVSSGGSSGVAGRTQASPRNTQPNLTVREAWELAKAQQAS